VKYKFKLIDNIFHILINDESLATDLFPVFNFFDDLRIPFVQIKNNNQLDYLIHHLPDSTKVAIWVHPNAGVRNEKQINTPGEASAIALSIHKIDFILISRYPESVSEKLSNQIGKNAIDLNELSEAVKNVKPILVSDLKKSSQSIAETTNFYEQNADVEVAIIAALYDDEFVSLKEFIVDEISVPGFETMKIVKFKDSEKKVLVDFQTKMGMVEATYLSTQILARFSPKYLIMVGVCGGRATKEIKLLDILIPSKVFDYQTGKYENGKFKPYLRVCNINNKRAISVSSSVLKSMEDYVNTPLKAKCKAITIRSKTLACGNVVVKTNGYLEDVISGYDEETEGVEMESFGVVRATELLEDKKVTPIIIKSVMDFTETNKNDKDKENAAFLSACFTYFLVKDHL